MKKLILALALIAMPSVAHAGRGHDIDGYSFDKKEYDKSTLTVTVVQMKNQRELQEMSDKIARKAGDLTWQGGSEEVKAFSVTRGKDGTTCTIYIIDPTVSYEADRLGHEVYHCFFGRFHNELRGR